MENDALKTYIQQCNASLQPNIALLYEASFFKIYVKFEQISLKKFLKVIVLVFQAVRDTALKGN